MSLTPYMKFKMVAPRDSSRRPQRPNPKRCELLSSTLEKPETTRAVNMQEIEYTTQILAVIPDEEG